MIVQLNRVQMLLAVTALTIASFFLASTVLSGTAEAKVRKGPAGLAFYKPPKKTPKQHGVTIWTRNATGKVKLKNAASTKLVLYTSKTPAGKRTAVSGSVSVPKGKAPRGGWPLISYGHGTTGIADKCAPTRIAAKGLNDGVTYTDEEHNAWLRAGYAIARSDYQGLGTPGTHAFLIGKASGRSVLDIARAAKGIFPKISKRLLLAGHSQGGHAALFAAGEAATYTPDLKLRGTVSYAPASHLRFQASVLPSLTSPSSLTALASLIVRGASAVSADIKPNELLSDPVLAYYPQTGTECLDRLGASDNLGGIAPSELIRDGANTEPLFSLLDKQNPATRTAAPILLAQGENDSVAFRFLTDQLDGELVALGDKVDYKVYPGTDHSGVIAAAKDDVMAFFKKRLPSGR